MSALKIYSTASRGRNAGHAAHAIRAVRLAAVGDCLALAVPLEDAAPFANLLDRVAHVEARRPASSAAHASQS